MKEKERDETAFTDRAAAAAAGDGSTDASGMSKLDSENCECKRGCGSSSRSTLKAATLN